MQTQNIQNHNTYRNRYIDEKGDIYPGFSKSCLEWLLTLPLKNYSVYEYGSEASAIWWKKSVNTFTGITHSPDLSKIIQCECLWNKDLYIQHISLSNINYDLIIINGQDRDLCVKNALEKIKKGGYLIINNYHQHSANFPPRYWKNTDFFTEKFPEVIFHEKESDLRTAVWQIVSLLLS